MRVLVTRPAAEASEWVRKLQARGIDAVALPLIDIQLLNPGPQDPGGPSSCDALMFVSPNAVRGFVRKNAVFTDTKSEYVAIEKIAFISPKTRAWATGPGTQQALLDAGWPSDRIDAPPADAAQWDARALWQVVQTQATQGAHVLVVRGQSEIDLATSAASATAPVLAGSAWLNEALQERGAVVHSQVVYVRQAPAFTSAQRDLALAATGPQGLWLMSSSEAIAHLRRWLPDMSWAQAQAIATHPRIAQAAREAGFGRVTVCKPSLPEVVASIESFA